MTNTSTKMTDKILSIFEFNTGAKHIKIDSFKRKEYNKGSMTVRNNTFATLFKKYRLKSEFKTLTEFGSTLATEGIVYEDSIFSHWQKGDRVPRDRKILISLIKLFLQKEGISHLQEANMFMEAAGQGYLTESEQKKLFATVDKNSQSRLFFDKTRNEPKTKYNFFQYILKNPLDAELLIEKEINLCNKLIYLGYPSISYKNLNKLEKILYELKLDKKKQGINLLSRIYWMRIRCLTDLTSSKDIEKLVRATDQLLFFVKQNSTSEIGPSYWIKSVVNRIELLTRASSKIPENDVKECVSLTELALAHTTKERLIERLREHLELAKLALILKDKNYFDRHIYYSFYCVNDMAPNSQYLTAIVWQVKARGDLRLNRNVQNALENIQNAQRYTTLYQAISLYIQDTEIHALRMSRDPLLLTSAKNHLAHLRFKLALLGNPYQELKMKKKQFIGL